MMCARRKIQKVEYQVRSKSKDHKVMLKKNMLLLRGTPLNRKRMRGKMGLSTTGIYSGMSKCLSSSFGYTEMDVLGQQNKSRQDERDGDHHIARFKTPKLPG
jgi:hypothetical protein